MNASCEAMLETRTLESHDQPGYTLRNSHSLSGNWLPSVPDIRRIRHSCEVLPKQRSPNNKYTIKYVGVTNGQIGILSTKRPIPRLPFSEVCTQQPLPLIYACESRRRLQMQADSPIKLVKRELDYIQTQAKSHLQKRSPLRSKVTPGEDFVVNRYAFPRGLVAVRRKRRGVAHKGELSLQLPTSRRGVTGWMLTSRLQESLPHHRARRNSPLQVSSTNYLGSLVK